MKLQSAAEHRNLRTAATIEGSKKQGKKKLHVGLDGMQKLGFEVFIDFLSCCLKLELYNIASKTQYRGTPG